MESGNVAATQKSARLQFNIFAIISISGFLKVFQLITNLGGLICIEASGIYANTQRSEYYLFVSATGLCVTGLLFLLYSFNCVGKFSTIPWLKFELVYCVLWTLFHFIAGMLTIGLINGYLNVAGDCCDYLYKRPIPTHSKTKLLKVGVVPINSALLVLNDRLDSPGT